MIACERFVDVAVRRSLASRRSFRTSRLSSCVSVVRFDASSARSLSFRSRRVMLPPFLERLEATSEIRVVRLQLRVLALEPRGFVLRHGVLLDVVPASLTIDVVGKACPRRLQHAGAAGDRRGVADVELPGRHLLRQVVGIHAGWTAGDRVLSPARVELAELEQRDVSRFRLGDRRGMFDSVRLISFALALHAEDPDGDAAE